MKKAIRAILAVILLAGLIYGVVAVVRQQIDYNRGEQEYAEARSLAGEELDAAGSGTAGEKTTDPKMWSMASIHLDNLQQINPEVVGWIDVPGTVIDYPVLQTDDNTAYLTKSWKQTDCSVGAIFMECQNRTDLSQFNTIVYGHNMRDGTMFCGLKEFQDQSYWYEHRYIYLAGDGVVRKYEIYAAYEVSTWEIIYGLEIDSEKRKNEFIEFGLNASQIDAGIVPTADDTILTLSTCTNQRGGRRWVVQAVCVDELYH